MDTSWLGALFFEAVFGLGNLLAVRLRGKGEEKG